MQPRMIRGLAAVASLMTCLALVGCPAYTTPEKSARVDIPAGYFVLDAISVTDVDPSEATELWEVELGAGGTTSYTIRLAGPRGDAGEGGTPIELGTQLTQPAAIADRAVGQGGVELIETATGDIVCRGTSASDQYVSIGLWDFPKDVGLAIRFACRDDGGSFTVPGSVNVQFGYVGAM